MDDSEKTPSKTHWGYHADVLSQSLLQVPTSNQEKCELFSTPTHLRWNADRKQSILLLSLSELKIGERPKADLTR